MGDTAQSQKPSAETLLMSDILSRMTAMGERSERHFKDIYDILNDVRERVTRVEERDYRAQIESLKLEHAKEMLILTARVDALEAVKDKLTGVGLAISLAKSYGPWGFGLATLAYLWYAHVPTTALGG